jgi:hypothetical protein
MTFLFIGFQLFHLSLSLHWKRKTSNSLIDVILKKYIVRQPYLKDDGRENQLALVDEWHLHPKVDRHKRRLLETFFWGYSVVR